MNAFWGDNFHATLVEERDHPGRAQPRTNLDGKPGGGQRRFSPKIKPMVLSRRDTEVMNIGDGLSVFAGLCDTGTQKF
jgi:hypothetical protein